MEDVFWLHANNPLTIEAIQNILSQQAPVKYSPVLTNNSDLINSKPLEEDITPANLMALAIGLGPEVPAEITRLLLLLLADFFAKNSLAASPSIISRLLEFYQFEIFPQVFSQGLSASPTTHLLMPVFGVGKIYYQNYLLKSADVHDIFSWQPIPWPESLPATLQQTPFLGLGNLLYCFLQFKKIFGYTQLLFPETDLATSPESLFPAQITLLETQLNEALAFPQDQYKHINGLTYQLEKLLATFGDHIAESFLEPLPEAAPSYFLQENIQVSSGHLRSLMTILNQENFILYESGIDVNFGPSLDFRNHLRMQPYLVLKNLEQITACATLLQLTPAVPSPANRGHSLANLATTYRKQVIDVLKEVVFTELIQKTITFMYVTVSIK